MSNKLCKGCGKPLDFNEKVCSNCGFDSILGKYKEIQKVRKISEETMKNLEFLFVCIIIIISSLLIIIIGIKKRIPVEPKNYYIEEREFINRKLAKEIFGKKTTTNNKIVTKSKIVKLDDLGHIYVCWETRERKNNEYETKICMFRAYLEDSYIKENNVEKIGTYLEIYMPINAILRTKQDQKGTKVLRVSKLNNAYYVKDFEILYELEKYENKLNKEFYFVSAEKNQKLTGQYKKKNEWIGFSKYRDIGGSMFGDVRIEKNKDALIRKYKIKTGKYEKLKSAENCNKQLGVHDTDYISNVMEMSRISNKKNNMENRDKTERNNISYRIKFKVYNLDGKKIEESRIDNTIKLYY